MATAVYADPEPQSLQALKHRLPKSMEIISPFSVRRGVYSDTSQLN